MRDIRNWDRGRLARNLAEREDWDKRGSFALRAQGGRDPRGPSDWNAVTYTSFVKISK